MESVYHKQAAAAVKAVTIHSSTAFSWFGRPAPRLSRYAAKSISPSTARDHLISSLQNQLYNDFYCQGAATPVSLHTVETQSTIAKHSFVESLSHQNCGRGRLDDQWVVQSLEDGQVAVQRDGLTIWVLPNDVSQDLPDAQLAAGSVVRIRLPKDLLGLSPGYYMALGNEDLGAAEPGIIVRLYWNVTPEGGLTLMRFVTSTLNQDRVRFRFKVLNEPNGYSRCDAAVLYVRNADYDLLIPKLERIYRRLADQLKPGVPAFTKEIATGVGVAEDHASAESFGTHRCRLLAEGIVRAHESDCRTLPQRLDVVEANFREAGVELASPYLNAGSADVYRDLRKQTIQRSPMTTRTAISNEFVEPLRWLSVSHAIGRRLVDDAIWHKGHCNWLGVAAEGAHGEDDHTTVYGALGPYLYSGTSGVGLFLAELASVTDDAEMRATALAALRHALSCVERGSTDAPIGLYEGWVGVVVSAAYIGRLCDDQELLERSRSAFRQLKDTLEIEAEYDLLAGSAGASVGLLILHDLLDDIGCLEDAIRLGERLLVAAREDVSQDGIAYSWRSVASPSRFNLTGMSHGTAGIGYALLELYQGVKDSRYRTASERAFNYERRTFDSSQRNWPDFREFEGLRKPHRSAPSFSSYWCHGAPGIALSRLRAHQMLGDVSCKAEAIVALQTTRQAIEAALSSRDKNFSLCHGLAGNAEVLNNGHQLLEARENDLAVVNAVGLYGEELHIRNGREWVCGTGGRVSPGLMLGLAGIGHFYLRLYDTLTPSVLLFQREQISKRLSLFRSGTASPAAALTVT